MTDLRVVFLVICGAAVSFTIGMAGPAYAYLDPGTGSIILQSIIGSIAAVLAFGAVYWERCKQFFRRITGKGAAETDPDND